MEPHTSYPIPAGTQYILMTVQKTVFALDVLPETILTTLLQNGFRLGDFRKAKHYHQKAYKLPPPTPAHTPVEERPASGKRALAKNYLEVPNRYKKIRIAPATRRIQRPPTPEPATSVFVPPPAPVVVSPPAPVFVSPPPPETLAPVVAPALPEPTLTDNETYNELMDAVFAPVSQKRKKMSTEMEIAKQKRKAVRATYSKTVNKLQELLAAESPDVDDLEIHLDQLKEKYKGLKDIGRDIPQLTSKESWQYSC
ncbi:uncharacterized protein NPIL_48291 [Nephila pilipes]|uniref:Uncharacterized protein n=1 Tax=Nephila pilipes TaxID=299642 RepID=A0A8X6TE05_NEPPI|nr:uncharacterized protein NPIL_48291 [Nephila pilipes]